MNKFTAWLMSTDRPSSTFSTSDSEGGAYKPLSAIIDQALLGDTGSVTRQDALRIMAILKGRNLICGISTLPLNLLDNRRKVVKDALFDQFDPQVPNVVHLSMTIEDLLFDGIAWWQITARDPVSKRPRNVKHIDSRRVSMQPPAGWSVHNPLPSGVDPDAVLWVDGKPQDAYNFIRFDSPSPGFLSAARRAIKRAILIEKAAEMYADNPTPSDYFTPANGYSAGSEDEVTANIRAWIAARKKRSTGYVPETLEYHTVQAPTPHELQLVELQKQASLDIANGIGVDPEDLGVSTTSRTYANATDRRRDRINNVLAPFMRAITDRLSMQDITRNGYRAAFILDDYMKADPKTRWEVHKIAHEMGATDIAEIRAEEDWVERNDLGATLSATDDGPSGLEEARQIAELIQKIYLGVGVVITAEEARDLANRAGAGLAAGGLPAPEEEEEPEPDKDAPAEQEESLMNHSVPATFAAPAEVDAAQTFRFDGDAMTFAADSERRTITGTILLYGVAADNGYGKFTFAKGALTWNKSAVSRVKFLRDHDWRNLLGHATAINSTDVGASATFKVARGAMGDEALTLAEDGALDGLSVGIDIVEWTDDKDGNFTVTKAVLNEVSLTPRPAFEDARLTKVTASKQDKENTMPDEKTPDAPATPDVSKLVADAVAAAFAKADADRKAAEAETAKAVELAKAEKTPEAPAAEKTEDKAADKAELSATDKDEVAMPINPTERPSASASFEVKEKSPYTFDGAGRFAKGEHEFSTDVVEMLKRGDFGGENTEFGKRVMAHIAQNFDVVSGNVSDLNPVIQQPNKYYEPKAARTVLWDMVNKGGLPNGLQPFRMPKFNSSGNLVNDHTEGVEPNSGTFTTTGQTVTPSAVSGKVTVSRETFDMGGNPATSNLIWNRMVREYRLGLERATAAFLATLTAAENIVLGPTASLADQIKAAIVALNFVEGYDFEAFAIEKDLYTDLAALEDSAGRPLFPILNPSNSDGSASSLFQELNIAGLRGVPAPALTPVPPATLNSSWLFDPSLIHGYADAPQRLEFAGSALGNTHAYAPVANVDIAIFGYKAFAAIDLGGVREVTYDPDAV